MITINALDIIAIKVVIIIQLYIHNAKNIFTKGIIYGKVTEFMQTVSVSCIFLGKKISP